MSRWLPIALLLQISPALAQNADFDGDGLIGFSDFFLFSEAFGGADPRFDLDGSGTVAFGDFFLFIDNFGRIPQSVIIDPLPGLDTPGEYECEACPEIDLGLDAVFNVTS